MTISTLQFTDYSDERSSVQINGVALTAANFDAQATASAALSVAVGALSIGELTKRTYAQVALDDPSIPTNPFAQRELKWYVSYRGDTSGKKFSLEIPCANVTDNLVPNTDIADLTSTDWANFVTAFESYARSPENLTETVTVLGARLVGRNI